MQEVRSKFKKIFKRLPEQLKSSPTTFKKFISKPEGFFVLFSLFFGVLFVFLVPPLQAPDENSHFRRAYQISNLDFVSKKFEKSGATRYGSDLPVSVNVAIDKLMGDIPGHPLNKFSKSMLKFGITQPLKPSVTERTIIEAAGTYSPVIYIPQAVGINLGKVFEAPPLILIWLGSLVNLLVWIVVVYFAIKILPFGKWGLVVLALNPLAVFLSASLSPDVINISFAFLFVSLILATFVKGRRINLRSYSIILAVLIVLALSKQVNILFVLLLFAIPVRYFRTRLKYIGLGVLGILLVGGLFILWNYQVREIFDAAVFAQSGGLHISVSDQLSYIIHNPFDYAKTVLTNMILVTPGTYGDAILTTYSGVFGWLDNSIPLWTMTLYASTLLFALLYQFGRGITLKLSQKFILLSLFALAFVGTTTALYVNSTPVGSHVIAGIQGRYFIPFSVLLIGIFTARKKLLQISNRSMINVLTFALLIIFIVTTIKLFLRYYH